VYVHRFVYSYVMYVSVCARALSAHGCTMLAMCVCMYEHFQKVFSLVHVTCVGLYVFSCMPNLYVSSER
jgi:hypothetical protein